jgi:hypothetical protein
VLGIVGGKSIPKSIAIASRTQALINLLAGKIIAAHYARRGVWSRGRGEPLRKVV